MTAPSTLDRPTTEGSEPQSLRDLTPDQISARAASLAERSGVRVFGGLAPVLDRMRPDTRAHALMGLITAATEALSETTAAQRTVAPVPLEPVVVVGKVESRPLSMEEQAAIDARAASDIRKEIKAYRRAERWERVRDALARVGLASKGYTEGDYGYRTKTDTWFNRRAEASRERGRNRTRANLGRFAAVVSMYKDRADNLRDQHTIESDGTKIYKRVYSSRHARNLIDAEAAQAHATLMQQRYMTTRNRELRGAVDNSIQHASRLDQIAVRIGNRSVSGLLVLKGAAIDAGRRPDYIVGVNAQLEDVTQDRDRVAVRAQLMTARAATDIRATTSNPKKPTAK